MWSIASPRRLHGEIRPEGAEVAAGIGLRAVVRLGARGAPPVQAASARAHRYSRCPRPRCSPLGPWRRRLLTYRRLSASPLACSGSSGWHSPSRQSLADRDVAQRCPLARRYALDS
eukprot:scaffold50177_cov78-Phaeocystis_antarctica.AAC.1